MKKERHHACRRVGPAKFGTFVQIATMASQCKICPVIRASVLPGDNVFYVMEESAMVLVKSVVLAPFGSPFTDKLPGSGIHVDEEDRLRGCGVN